MAPQSSVAVVVVVLFETHLTNETHKLRSNFKVNIRPLLSESQVSHHFSLDFLAKHFPKHPTILTLSVPKSSYKFIKDGLHFKRAW